MLFGRDEATFLDITVFQRSFLSYLVRMGGKKDRAQLGRNLMKSKAQTKKGRRVAQQEGYLHTTDMQVFPCLYTRIWIKLLCRMDMIGAGLTCNQ